MRKPESPAPDTMNALSLLQGLYVPVTPETLTGSALANAYLESAPDATVITTTDGEIIASNSQLFHLLGYSASTLHGKSIEQLIPERFHASHRQYIARFALAPEARGMGTGRALFALTAADEELPIEVSLSPIRVGETTLVAAALRDVTPRLEAEALLRSAKEEAERANASKSRFLAAASHDLRQPLQAIQLYLSVLERTSLDSKARDVTSRMAASLDTMGELLDTLLDISRLDRGVVEPEIDDVPLHNLLRGLYSSNLRQAEEKGLTLTLTGTDAVACTDPGLLARIVDNLITNAIRYTESGGVTVSTAIDGDRVRITVSDTGVGIPEDQLDRVFEEYHQLDNAVRDRRKGLGLGLAIVKLLSELLDHPITVTSEVGRGSAFQVSVPCSSESAVRDTASVPARPQVETVLLVEGRSYRGRRAVPAARLGGHDRDRAAERQRRAAVAARVTGAGSHHHRLPVAALQRPGHHRSRSRAT